MVPGIWYLVSDRTGKLAAGPAAGAFIFVEAAADRSAAMRGRFVRSRENRRLLLAGGRATGELFQNETAA